MLCFWFAVGLIEEELVKEELAKEGRQEMAEHRERERQSIRQSIVKGKVSEYRVYYVFLLVLFFFNIMLMWKIVGALKISVIYIYIYIYINRLYRFV